MPQNLIYDDLNWIEVYPVTPENKLAGVTMWSGTFPLPIKGQRINVRHNDLGFGTVVGFFVIANYAGVAVKLENPPDWYLKQNELRRKDPEGWPAVLVYGREIEWAV